MNCPTCRGYLHYFPAYYIGNGEEVPADLRCINCGRSVIYTTHESIEEEKGSGYSKKGPEEKTCICGCGKKFIDRTSNQMKKFFDYSHKVKYGNLANNRKRIHDEEEKRIGRIKWKVRHQNEIRQTQKLD